MGNTRGNAHEAEQGNEYWVSDSAPKDTESTVATTERSAAWQEADEARARANDLTTQAQEATNEANIAEAKAIASDEEVEYEEVDPSAGTWEASVAAEAEGTPAKGSKAK